MTFRRMVAVSVLGLSLISGCGGDGKTDVTKDRLKAMAGGQLKDVVVVKGVVTIDGSPVKGVNLFLYRENELANPVKEAQTDDQGKYCWSTSTACDGLEPGIYGVGFTYVPKAKKDGSGVDALKGKYRNPQKNKIEFKMELKVEKGAPQENVNYELVTK